MPGLQLRLFQFDRLVEEILPLIHTNFVKKGVKSSMYASQWFMTMFSYRFPLSLVYRVLDIVFAEGIEAIFRFSLALLKKSEDLLVTLEFEQILAKTNRRMTGRQTTLSGTRMRSGCRQATLNSLISEHHLCSIRMRANGKNNARSGMHTL
jgi:hypothetical protein